jgi:phosphoribosylformylglycinamidine cyclo-ligase
VHRSYLAIIKKLAAGEVVSGMAHITGGGITENLPRTLPEGRGFSLDRHSWAVPPLFAWLQRAGGVDDAEMFRTFNMGVGLIIVCDPAHAADLTSALPGSWVLGNVV